MSFRKPQIEKGQYPESVGLFNLAQFLKQQGSITEEQFKEIKKIAQQIASAEKGIHKKFGNKEILENQKAFFWMKIDALLGLPERKAS